MINDSMIHYYVIDSSHV